MGPGREWASAKEAGGQVAKIIDVILRPENEKMKKSDGKGAI